MSSRSSHERLGWLAVLVGGAAVARGQDSIAGLPDLHTHILKGFYGEVMAPVLRRTDDLGGFCPDYIDAYQQVVTINGITNILSKSWQQNPYGCIPSADSSHQSERIVLDEARNCNMTIRTENLCTRNVYMELGYPMPPVTAQCGFTDQPGCWVLQDIEKRAGRAPLSCHRCCMKDDGSCWDYINIGQEVHSMGMTAWELKRDGDGIMQRKDYCCRGKLAPNMVDMHRKIIALSKAQDEEYWPVCGTPGADDGGTDDSSCWDERWAIDNSAGCEMCCYNPAYHPTPWNDASNNVKVSGNPCFKKGALKQDHESNYEAWRRCCMSTCDANMSQMMCSIMPWIPWIALGAFMAVLILCCIFEWSMIEQKCCFAPGAMTGSTTENESGAEDLETGFENLYVFIKCFQNENVH
jgi:hypothetical protein